MCHLRRRALPGIIFVLVLLLITQATAACSDASPDPGDLADQAPAASPPTSTPDPLAQAAAEATAIVQRAEATALVMQAEALAAEIQQTAAQQQPEGNVDAQAAAPDPVSTQEAAAPDATVQANGADPSPEDEMKVEIIGVGFAGEGGFIHVQYRAAPGLAKRWSQGLVSVTDEDTGHEYLEIPVMPKVGPLIGRPIREGQPGYVMFVNGPVRLQPGATVTVKLGSYIEEGITVQG